MPAGVRRSAKNYVAGLISGVCFVTTVLASLLLIFVFIYDENPISADPLKDNETIRIHDSLILSIDRDLSEELVDLWDSHNNSEYSICIGGKKTTIMNESEDRYEDVVMTLTHIVEKNEGGENYVQQANCGEVAVLHNHPSSYCSDRIWTGDVESAKSAFRRGISFYLIQCGRNKIEVYSRDDMWSGKIIELDEVDTSEIKQ